MQLPEASHFLLQHLDGLGYQALVSYPRPYVWKASEPISLYTPTAASYMTTGLGVVFGLEMVVASLPCRGKHTDHQGCDKPGFRHVVDD